MTCKRIAQTNQQQKSEKPQESGILQRAAVRSVSDAGVQSTDDQEAQPLSNSAFSKDFSRVPISTIKPQQFQARNLQSHSMSSIHTKMTQEKGEMTSDRQVSSEAQHPNKTGLPNRLKVGFENLSGLSMDDVRVHYNSPKPAQLNALAYTQGIEIHVAPGQEQHLPHEVGHVVQQIQGKVKPTVQMKGVQINDDEGLEKEADEMGKAVTIKNRGNKMETQIGTSVYKKMVGQRREVIQGVFVYSFQSDDLIDTDKDDTYYRSIGFIPLKDANGRSVWTDKRNQEKAIALIDSARGKQESESPSKATLVYLYTLEAPTHENQWQKETSLDKRLSLIKNAVSISLKQADGKRADNVLYILTAPEYFFAAMSEESHFMTKKEHDKMLEELNKIVDTLPENYVLIPGTIGYAEDIKQNEKDSKIQELQQRHQQLLEYVNSYKKSSILEGENNMALMNYEAVMQEYKFTWEEENKLNNSDLKQVLNRAYIFYNKEMEFYDKMFESVSDDPKARDRSNSDYKSTIFMHGVKPFVRNYQGVKISLQICSDLAYESLRGIDETPHLQIVPALHYGTAQNYQQARTLLVADSKGSSIVDMHEKGKLVGEKPSTESLENSCNLAFRRVSIK